MGYSIMCPFKSEDIKNKMLSFLSENYRTYESISKCGCSDWISEPTTKLSYGPDNNIPVIGFNYSGCDFDSDYAFRMCYWMAVMAGDIKDVIVDNKKYHNHKYIIYDGDEDIPVSINKDSRLRDVIGVNQYGFKPIAKTRVVFLNRQIKNANLIIEKELLRLTDLYLSEIDVCAQKGK